MLRSESQRGCCATCFWLLVSCFWLTTARHKKLETSNQKQKREFRQPLRNISNKWQAKYDGSSRRR